MRTILSFCVAALLCGSAAGQQKLLIAMDLQQADHLKAYGIAYWMLDQGMEIDWLLNYRGGSFMMDRSETVAAACRIRGVKFEQVGAGGVAEIYSELQREDNNMDVVRLEKAPRVAVYVPPNFQPWDDAVTLALEYAEIPYEKVWDQEVLEGMLSKYDWLHLHHEDFTGQYGKFHGGFRGADWYIRMVQANTAMADELGFEAVQKLKAAVALKIREYVEGGDVHSDRLDKYEHAVQEAAITAILGDDWYSELNKKLV